MLSPYGTNGSINGTDLNWRPGPKMRGSYDILSICVVTISLCVWSALHVNIPAYGVPTAFINKLCWMACGLLAPEIVRYHNGPLEVVF
jgi:hypothetical protein